MLEFSAIEAHPKVLRSLRSKNLDSKTLYILFGEAIESIGHFK